MSSRKLAGQPLEPTVDDSPELIAGLEIASLPVVQQLSQLDGSRIHAAAIPIGEIVMFSLCLRRDPAAAVRE